MPRLVLIPARTGSRPPEPLLVGAIFADTGQRARLPEVSLRDMGASYNHEIHCFCLMDAGIVEEIPHAHDDI